MRRFAYLQERQITRMSLDTLVLTFWVGVGGDGGNPHTNASICKPAEADYGNDCF